MSDDALRYDRMVETALRGVVREALTQVAARGLPGNHHFYITFRTDHPEVSLATSLRERFPAEMTIVLQHQFWGLKVEAEAFEVTLSFSDKPERLVIPFAAVTSFADPSVRFGLQFEAGEGAGLEGLETEPSGAPAAKTAKPAGTALTPVPDAGEEGRETVPAATKPSDTTSDEAKRKPASGQGSGERSDERPQERRVESGKKPGKAEPAEVVSLDAFRKK